MAEALLQHHAFQHHLRRGICLLAAGSYAQAREAYAQAAALNPDGHSLARALAACAVGQGNLDAAIEALNQHRAEAPQDLTSLIQQALLIWQQGRPAAAIASLRRGVQAHPESAELHFQLGTLLAGMNELDEAELRFTQAIAIDPTHSEALVSLALCHGAQHRPGDAKRCLDRAQARRPHDARIGMLLSQAAQALAVRGEPVAIRAEMPSGTLDEDGPAIDELSRVIAQDPDFIDALLTMPNDSVDQEVHGLIAEIVHRALDRTPASAELHCANGKVLMRMGRADEAIAATEQAVKLNPRFVNALLQLGKLYQQTSRLDAAVDRLEEAVRLGAKYADVYYLLGNLYRDQGRIEQARTAYTLALNINAKYEAARNALASLAA